jgi:hypothetical protein
MLIGLLSVLAIVSQGKEEAPEATNQTIEVTKEAPRQKKSLMVHL